MLRLIFVFGLILIGTFFALQGPFYLLLFYLWNAYFRPELWVWTDYISPLKLSLTIGICLVLTSVTALQRFRFSSLNVLIVLFFAQSLLSVVASEHLDVSIWYWVEFSKVLIITLLITVLVTDKARYRTTLLVIGLSLGMEQAKQGWAQLVLNPGASNNNPHPVLGDNNGVAVGMMMLVPVFLALAQTASRRWERRFHRFMVVGLFYRGISTYSRGGFLSAAALGLVTLWRSPQRVRALLSIVALSIVVWFAMPQKFWDRMGTIIVPAEEQESASEGRVYFWQVAVRMANAKPFTGIGFNGFKSSFASYDFKGGEYGIERAVHSTWFGVLAEMGYPGLVLLIGVLILAFRTSIRVLMGARRDPNQQELAVYARAMQTTLFVFVVGMSFLNAQYNEMFWHIVGLTVTLGQLYASATEAMPAWSAASQVSAPLVHGGAQPLPLPALKHEAKPRSVL
jgi:probable O-glycosylation ligase (exosortase A-associated)